MNRSSFLFLAAIAGFATHHLIFRHGEWHMQAPTIFRFYLTSMIAVAALAILIKGLSDGLWISLVMTITYLFSLFTSIALYRATFHRLSSFPGPFWAGISKFWHVYQCIASSSQNHMVLDALHEKYGDFVRTGPSEITVFHADIFQILDGPGNSCSKAVWYDFLLPDVAVNTTRNKGQHDKRRRIWDHGFSTKALAEYQKRIVEYAVPLDQHIEASTVSGEGVEITSWLYWYSFDVMGEFAFARSFNMLRDEKWHHAIVMLRRAMSLLGPLSPVPWLAQLAFNLIPHTWVVKDWFTMMDWCKARMAERIEMAPDRVDVSSYLIDASKRTNSIEEDRIWLNGDSIAIIIAGSDTVAPTLIFILYELAKNPYQAEKLWLELSKVDCGDHKALQSLPHLNAIINETLRIHPPVPSGGYRETPPTGINVAGRFIPGGTTIVAPRYTIGRLESCFEKANEFIPERWYEKPEMIKNKKAFAPFSQGRYSCVGKNLALNELRYVTALFVSKYRINFCPGSRISEVEEAMRDQFTASPGSLKLVFDKR